MFHCQMFLWDMQGGDAVTWWRKGQSTQQPMGYLNYQEVLSSGMFWITKRSHWFSIDQKSLFCEDFKTNASEMLSFLSQQE